MVKVSAFVAVSWLVIVSVSARADESRSRELKQRFLSAYEPAVARLQSFYENIVIRARYTDVTPGEPESFKQYEVVYMARRPLFRIDSKGRFLPSGEVSHVRNLFSHYPSFVVEKPAGAGKFRLVNFKRFYDSERNFRSWFPNIPCDAYCLGGDEIARLMRFDRYIITAFEPVSEEKRHLLKLTWYFDQGKKPDRNAESYIIFNTERCWAAEECVLNQSSYRKMRYGADLNGIPLIESWERLWRDSNGKVSRRITGRVIELIPEAPPESVFLLSAFGLREPSLGEPVPWWYYMQLIAVSLATAAIVIWRLRRRDADKQAR